MRSSSLLFVQCCALLVTYVLAAEQSVQYDRQLNGNVWTIDMTFYPNDQDGFIKDIGVADTATGNIDLNCLYTNGNGFVYDSDGFQMTFSIDTTTDTLSHDGDPSLSCPILEGPEGQYTFYIRSLEDVDTTHPGDREFMIEAINDDTSIIATSEDSNNFVGPQDPTLDSLTPKTLDTRILEVVDESGSFTSSIALGHPIGLRFTMRISSFDAGIDVRTAKLHSCYVDSSSSMTESPVQIIGSSGCWIANDVFDNMWTDRGANKNDGESSEGATLTFVTDTDYFEAVRFKPDDANVLYFECDVSFCFSDDCDNSCRQKGRKKRDITTKPDLTLSTSVTLYHNETVCEKCVKSTTFVASTASIGTLAAILFGLMTCAFVGARKVGMSPYLKGHRSKMDHYRSNSSTQSLKSGSSAERSSSAGSVSKF